MADHGPFECSPVRRVDQPIGSERRPQVSWLAATTKLPREREEFAEELGERGVGFVGGSGKRRRESGPKGLC